MIKRGVRCLSCLSVVQATLKLRILLEVYSELSQALQFHTTSSSQTVPLIRADAPPCIVLAHFTYFVPDKTTA